MRTCAKAVREAAKALEEERHLDAVRHGVDVFLLCDKKAAEKFLAEHLAPAAARLAVKDTVALVKKLTKAGMPILPALYNLWQTLDKLAFNCEAMEKVILSALETAKETEWPGPRWILAAPVLTAMDAECGEIPDTVVEALGEEWGSVEAFLQEEIAKVYVGGSRADDDSPLVFLVFGETPLTGFGLLLETGRRRSKSGLEFGGLTWRRDVATGFEVLPASCAANVVAHGQACALCRWGPCGDVRRLKVDARDVEEYLEMRNYKSVKVSVEEPRIRINKRVKPVDRIFLQQAMRMQISEPAR